MSPPRWLRPTLIVVGGLFALAGSAAIGIGLFAAAWLRTRLPGITAEPGVVGGAAVAFGAALVLLGLLHVAIASGLARPSRLLRAGAVVAGLALAMSALLGLASVGVTLAREASATPLWAAVPPLLAALFVYATLAVSLLRVERR